MDDFDVFLSHNSRDKPVVEQIGKWLGDRGLRVWLDAWQLRPGFPWQEGLEAGVQASRAVAVLVGAVGLGAWQEPEMRAFIARSRSEQIPVIPVLLPGCPDSPQLTLFLKAYTWVDLRPGLTDGGLARLLWGITGTRPQAAETVVAAPRENRTLPGERVAGLERAGSGSAGRSGNRTKRRALLWSIGLSILGIVATLGAWFRPNLFGPPPPPLKPTLYAVRVQVVDPQGHPVTGSSVRASAGNEPHLLPDGWWQVEIPAAKVPAGGRIKLWAVHVDWEGSSAVLSLGMDPNPQVEIRLKEPESWLRGRVVDGSGRALLGIRVSRQDGPSGVVITDAEGRFALKLAVPPGAHVRVGAERAGSQTVDTYCYAGRDSCSVVLERR